jgi:cytochrome c553
MLKPAFAASTAIYRQKALLATSDAPSALATGRSVGYIRNVSSVEEIERAVKKLPRNDFAKLAAWMDKHQAEAANQSSGPGAKLGADWFDIYMTCPHSFKIPPRKRQFYKPGK